MLRSLELDGDPKDLATTFRFVYEDESGATFREQMMARGFEVRAMTNLDPTSGRSDTITVEFDAVPLAKPSRTYQEQLGEYRKRLSEATEVIADLTDQRNEYRDATEGLEERLVELETELNQLRAPKRVIKPEQKKRLIKRKN